MIDFDAWEDFVKIKLWGTMYRVKMATYLDSKKIAEVQERLEKSTEIEQSEAMVDFLHGRFKAAGATFDREKLMDLPPAKIIAMFRVITQGEGGDRPLPLAKDPD
jgi:hypothetical protein